MPSNNMKRLKEGRYYYIVFRDKQEYIVKIRGRYDFGSNITGYEMICLWLKFPNQLGWSKEGDYHYLNDGMLKYIEPIEITKKEILLYAL